MTSQWISRRENYLHTEACLLMSWIWMEKREKYPKKPPKWKLALTWICNREFVLWGLRISQLVTLLIALLVGCESLCLGKSEFSPACSPGDVFVPMLFSQFAPPSSFPSVSTSLSSVCISVAARQMDSSAPSLCIPYACVNYTIPALGESNLNLCRPQKHFNG